MSLHCTNPSFYSPDPRLRALGIEDEERVRQEILWEAAVVEERPGHLDECRYCSDLWTSLLRVKRVARKEAEPVTLAQCPGAETLANFHYGEVKGEAGDRLQQHLNECEECKRDLAFVARSQEPRDRAVPIRRRLIFMGIAAAALIVSLLPWHKKPPAETLGFTPSQRYAHLAEMPGLDRNEMFSASPKNHRPQLERLVADYEKGDYKQAADNAEIVTQVVDDASAEFIRGMALYHQGKLPEAFMALRRSEKMDPPSEYRCWGLLQAALMLGDKKTIEREVQHTRNNPAYRQRCEEILKQL